MTKYNPYQVICKGLSCSSYEECNSNKKKDCILKESSKKYLKGCNYSKEGDCKYCSHRNKCELIKPYSDKLCEIENKRHYLEKENKLLYEYIDEWKEIENKLPIEAHWNNKSYKVYSVLDVINFPKERNTIGKMLDEIHDNKKLIEDYLNVEKRIIKDKKRVNV